MVNQEEDINVHRFRLASILSTNILCQPRARRLFNMIIRAEGGHMTSATLRRVLSESMDITVGPYSYGSLLDLGMCDQHAEIGAYCSIGKNVRRYGAAHPIDAPSMHPYFYNPALGLAPSAADVERRHITIKADVWIGSNVTILPGCSYIGFGAVIGAGAVVTKDVEDFAVVVGNPASVIRYRHSIEIRQLILDSRYWELPPAEAQRVLSTLTQ